MGNHHPVCGGSSSSSESVWVSFEIRKTRRGPGRSGESESRSLSFEVGGKEEGVFAVPSSFAPAPPHRHGNHAVWWEAVLKIDTKFFFAAMQNSKLRRRFGDWTVVDMEWYGCHESPVIVIYFLLSSLQTCVQKKIKTKAIFFNFKHISATIILLLSAIFSHMIFGDL